MTETATPPKDALRLQEAIASPTTPLADDGTVVINVIRPTVGLGKGRHLYESKMLQEHAHIFGEHEEEGMRVPGWRMFADHEVPKAIRDRGGLPRPIEHMGGRIEESWWNADVPAEGRFGQGAIQARVRPVGLVRRLLEEDPQILEASINAEATGVHPGHADGQQVWVVEGIANGGSVDWVSEGGAGGKVVELMEAMITEYEERESDDPFAVLEALSDDELRDYVTSKRTGLLEGAGEESKSPEGGDKLDPNELKEALTDPESGVKEYLDSLVEARVREGQDEIRAEAKAEADRQVQLRDMRDDAGRIIEATDLPESWKKDLAEKFTLIEGKPTSGLDQHDEVDDEGEVTKSAKEFLTEAVEAEIEKQRKLLAEAAPTRIEGQGGSGEGDGSGESTASNEPPFYETFLQEAGIKDPKAAYGARPAEPEEAEKSGSEAEAEAAAAA